LSTNTESKNVVISIIITIVFMTFVFIKTNLSLFE